jgi:hypothetical protein
LARGGIEMLNAVFVGEMSLEEVASFEPDLCDLGCLPSVEEMGRSVLNRFYDSVRRMPHEFKGEKALQAIIHLEKAVARTGGRLEQLGTCRKKVFSEVRRIISNA